MEQDPHHIVGNPYTAEVFHECKRCNINVDSMRWFIPFATVVWRNTKGRIASTVMNTDLVREPIASDWCTTDMSVDDILRKIKDRDNGPNGGYKTNNVFFRAQSGHGTLREEQRPGAPYDFRHNILIHKTKVPYWRQMSRNTDRYLRCQGRDIQLVPIQFMLTEPEMLRDYGGRVLLFNTNYQKTRDALETARETNNGYILVSNDIHLGTLEAVFDLDNNNTWDFPYTPETTVPQQIADHGIEEATHILHYYSEVVHKRETILGDLPAGLKQVLRDIENHYLAHLPYPGGTPAEATAGTTASIERETAAKDDAINRVVREVYANAKQQQKLRVEAKSMPKEHPVPETPAASSTTSQPVKGPPAVVLEQRAKEAAAKKVKPPPKKLIEQLQQRPSADTPAKASTDTANATSDTTVMLEPRQPKHPPPPKRPADKTAETADAAAKKTKQEEIPTPPAARRQSQNKMPTPPATPSTTARAIPPQPTRPAP